LDLGGAPKHVGRVIQPIRNFDLELRIRDVTVTRHGPSPIDFVEALSHEPHDRTNDIRDLDNQRYVAPGVKERDCQNHNTPELQYVIQVNGLSKQL